MPRFQILKENLSSLPYWRMEPKPELAVGGPCLAIPGQIYAFFVKPVPAGSHGAEITVNLTALPGSGALQWINTWTGERSTDKVDHPGVYQLKRPNGFGDAPALLIVRAGNSQ